MLAASRCLTPHHLFSPSSCPSRPPTSHSSSWPAPEAADPQAPKSRRVQRYPRSKPSSAQKPPSQHPAGQPQPAPAPGDAPPASRRRVSGAPPGERHRSAARGAQPEVAALVESVRLLCEVEQLLPLTPEGNPALPVTPAGGLANETRQPAATSLSCPPRQAGRNNLALREPQRRYRLLLWCVRCLVGG